MNKTERYVTSWGDGKPRDQAEKGLNKQYILNEDDCIYENLCVTWANNVGSAFGAGGFFIVVSDEDALVQVGCRFCDVNTLDDHLTFIIWFLDTGLDCSPTAQVSTQHRRFFVWPGVFTQVSTSHSHTNGDIPPAPISQVHFDAPWCGDHKAKEQQESCLQSYNCK